MKVIAYSVFVISVLLMSGFAKADLMTPFVQNAVYATTVHIDEVIPSNDGAALKIVGFLPNPCHGRPFVFLTNDTKHPFELVLSLSSPLPKQDACVERTEPFESVVDLAVSAQSAGVKLDAESVYIVRVEGTDFAMQVRGADLMMRQLF